MPIIFTGRLVIPTFLLSCIFLKVEKVAFDRLVTRQFKVEKNFDKFCRETKSALKYFTDQIEDQSD